MFFLFLIFVLFDLSNYWVFFYIYVDIYLYILPGMYIWIDICIIYLYTIYLKILSGWKLFICYYMLQVTQGKVNVFKVYTIQNIVLSKNIHQNRIWSKPQSIYKISEKKKQIIFSFSWIVIKMLNHMSPIRFINPKAFPVFHSLFFNEFNQSS